MLLVRVDASLYFANMAFVEDWLRGTLASCSDVTHIIFDMSGVNDMEAVALSAMERMGDGYSDRDIAVAFFRHEGPCS